MYENQLENQFYSKTTKVVRINSTTPKSILILIKVEPKSH